MNKRRRYKAKARRDEARVACRGVYLRFYTTYALCGCSSASDGHCMYCLRPKSEHGR